MDHDRQAGGKGLADTQFIDALADTQGEPSETPIEAGVSRLQVLYHNGSVALPVQLSVQTSTGFHRGVHMSRLVQAASARASSSGLEEWLREICREVNRTQPGARATCNLNLPYADRFVPVAIRLKEKGKIRYRITANGMTACPCSKKMIGIGHMQRAEVTMLLDSKRPIDLFKTIERMEGCFSAIPVEKMKRIEEARKILDAQAHPKFAEDLVRECVRRFPETLYVAARCFESIHAHDAVASWAKRPDWEPMV